MGTTTSLYPSPKTPVLQEDNYLTHTKGFLSWACTLDHKRIGVMYLVGILAALTSGGILALVIRLQLFSGRGFLSQEAYNHVFTLHGAIMTFLFIIPSIPAALV